MKTQNSSFASHDPVTHHNHETFLLEMLNSLNPSHTLEKSQIYRLQLTMSFNCTVICCGVCRLYMSIARENKWKQTNIEGSLTLCIDKELNYAPILRIIDLNNFKIRFDLELFNGFDQCIVLANPYFMVINLPKVVKNYFGFSFAKPEDAKLMYDAIIRLTSIINLPEIITLPTVQEMLVRRNIAFQSKDINEKYANNKSSPVQISASMERPQQSLIQGRQPDFQKIRQQAQVLEYSHFWGDDQQQAQERELLEGGRVTNAQNQFYGVQHTPQNSKRGDLFHGDPNMVLYNNPTSQQISKQNAPDAQLAMNGVLQSFARNDNTQVLPNSIIGHSDMGASLKPGQNNLAVTQRQDDKLRIVDPNSLMQTSQLAVINKLGNQSSSNNDGAPNFNQNLSMYSHNDQLQQPMQNTKYNRSEHPQQQQLQGSSRQQQLLAPAQVIEAQQYQGEFPQRSQFAQNKSQAQQNLMQSQRPQPQPGLTANQQRPSEMIQTKRNVESNIPIGGMQHTEKTAKPQQQVQYSPLEQEQIDEIITKAIAERRKQMQKNMYESDEKSSWEHDEY